MLAARNRLDGHPRTLVHIVTIRLTRIHHARSLAVAIEGILRHLGVDATRDDDGGLDLRILQRNGLIEAVDGVLRSAVGRPHGETKDARHRRHNGNVNASLDEHLLQRLHQIDAAKVVHLHQSAIHADVGLKGQCSLRDTRIKQQKINQMTLAVNPADQLVNRLRALDIYGLNLRLDAQRLTLTLHLLQRLKASARENDIRTLLGILISHSLADTATAARNEHGFILKLQHF